MSAETLYVRVRFFEPIRVVPHVERNARKADRVYQRGGTYGRWHKVSDTHGAPYIPGTLLRSALTREIEHLLTLNNPYCCCRAAFKTEEPGLKLPEYLRRTDGFHFADEPAAACNDSDPCPLCLLLGRYDEKRRTDKRGDTKNWTVHFDNPSLAGRPELPWKETVFERVANRVDSSSGKAKDYFRIYEIDNRRCPEFFAAITLNVPKKAGEVKKLIAAGLAKVNLLAGALCRLDIVDSPCGTDISEHDSLISAFIKDAVEIDRQAGADSSPRVPDTTPVTSVPDQERIESLAIGIAAIERLEQGQKLRQMADAIKSLRLLSLEEIKKLPEGKTKDNPTIWAKKPAGEQRSLKAVLADLCAAMNRGQWVQFCAQLAEAVYTAHKKKIAALPSQPRLLGETEYYAKPSDRNIDPEYLPQPDDKSHSHVVLISGTLRAETPFCFGLEASGGLSGNPIVLTCDGAYRLPRSVVRGALRRDLREILATGCVVELGRNRPCDCPVCEVMRSVTVCDAVSEYREPPEVRQRIRVHPHRGTVEEGALFDVETAPQGLTFPFILRITSVDENIPQTLHKVLERWQQGRLQLGGDAGIGMGRFSLNANECIRHTLSDPEGLADYLYARSAVDPQAARSGEKFDFESIGERISGVHFSPPAWKKISVRLGIDSPFFSNDPVAAMLHPDNRDAVMVNKRVLAEDGASRSVFCLRGSSLRGALRFAAGKNRKDTDTGKFLHDLDHEECDCVLCRLFGNKHQIGKIRAEDAAVVGGAEEMRCDHVAIDRFHGGAVDKKKYDDWPLAATPLKPLCLETILWVRSELEDDEKEIITEVLSALRDGFIPLGASSGIGYGHVGSANIKDEDGTGFELPPAENYNAYEDQPCADLAPKPDRPNLRGEHLYHPHYFLKSPDETPQRELRLVSHGGSQHSPEGLVSGVIRCSLTTLGPVFVPDTHGASNKEGEHKRFGFFNVNGLYAIPGSELRGMVSSMYEALTNSCYRIMEEGRYLTRREPPKGQKGEVLLPGRVERDEDGSFCIRQYGEPNQENQGQVRPVRLPLYDDFEATKSITLEAVSRKPDKASGKVPKASEEKLRVVLNNNQRIAETARKNRQLLLSLPEGERLKIFDGCKEIYFKEFQLSAENPNDILAEMVPESSKNAPGVKSGFVKFTGLNFANQKNAGTRGTGLNKDADARKLNMLLGSPWMWRASLKTRYPRPCLQIVSDNKRYTIPKRCERIFTDPQDQKTFTVSKTVQRKYNQVLSDYRDNYGRIDEHFLTYIPHKELAEGDLVYFSHDGSAVRRIVPVPISRLVDSKPMLARIHEALRPCTVECGEECESCPERCKKVADYFSPHPKGLCPACHLFGTPYYKGRVNFGFAWLRADEPKWYVPEGEHELTLKLLERPRPTWSMPKDKSPVPGRKIYVHHPKSVDALKTSPASKGPNNTTVTPFDSGNTFSFELQFNNLRQWELGLLLYCLELEEGLGHKLGMGKPLGLGSCRIRIRKVLRRDNVLRDVTDDKNNLILNHGLQQLEQWFGKPWHSLEHIRNLRDLGYVPQNFAPPVQYPPLKQSNDGIPGYVEMQKEEEKDHSPRLTWLTTPWMRWHPRKTCGTSTVVSKGKKSTPGGKGGGNYAQKKPQGEKGFANTQLAEQLLKLKNKK